jgi:hypothetical protein
MSSYFLANLMLEVYIFEALATKLERREDTMHMQFDISPA